MTQTPEMTLARLRDSQIRMIADLNDTPSLLGCSELIAKRMSKPARLRPALTVEVTGYPDGYSRFKLSGHGLAVQRVTQS